MQAKGGSRRGPPGELRPTLRSGHLAQRTLPSVFSYQAISRHLIPGLTLPTGRYPYTGPVWPETYPNRLNSNLNSKATVQSVWNGLPVGLTGLPAGLAGLPVGLTGNRPNSIFFLFMV